MHSGHIPPIKRNKTKTPSASTVAAAAAEAQIQKATARWEIEAVSKGSTDPQAQLQAAKLLVQLVHNLAQQRSACKHGAVRVLLQKQLQPGLILALLGSEQAETLGLTLLGLQDLACIAPAVIPLDAAPRLLQLLCCHKHGAGAARVLTTQLSHWRCSQLWPHWTAADMTAKVFQHLQQLHVLAKCSEAASGTAASKAVDGCVNVLALLAKLVLLSEQQMLLQLAPDLDTASRWLQLLLQFGRRNWHQTSSASSLQLQDSCCALLAGMSHATATSAALADGWPLRQQLLQLLHGVLHRPCCLSEADASQVLCWRAAAATASLPVLWQPQDQHQQPEQVAEPQSVAGSVMLTAREVHQLLEDIAISAAATLCNECFCTSAAAKQVEGAAASLLAAALLPAAGRYGTHRACTSRFMSAVLGSNCCQHVLLHALAVSSNTNSEQTVQLQAAAAAAARAAQSAPTAGPHSIILAPVQPDSLQPSWLLLRMICAQCAAVSSDAAAAGVRHAPLAPGVSGPASRSSHSATARQQAGSLVQPEQVLRVVQAYCTHITSSADAHRVWGVLRSLHFLMCQAVLTARNSSSQHRQSLLDAGKQGQEHEELYWKPAREQLQWPGLVSSSSDAANSCSSSNDGESVQLGGQQLLQTAAALLELVNDSSSSVDHLSSSSNAHRLVASVYVSLAIAACLQEREHQHPLDGAADAATDMGSPKCLSAADCCLAVSALQLAAAALKLLLPLVVDHVHEPSAAADTAATQQQQQLQEGQQQEKEAGQQQQQQQRPVLIPVYEALTCSLAAVQALASLAALVQPALPGLLQECVDSISSGRGGAQAGAAGSTQPSEHVALPAVKWALAAAAAALDTQLQRQLSHVVLSWQASPADSSADNPAAPPSVQANLLQQTQQELRCWAASALVSCYGQLGARTWQGAVLEPFRGVDVPFADVLLRLSSGDIAAHAAILAAACPVLRQQLLSATKAPAVSASSTAAAVSQSQSSGADDSESSSLLVLKLSAAVNAQALQQALDFIYTGAVMLPDAGLLAQLQLSCECLDHATLPSSRQLAQQQKVLMVQRQRLQQLQEMRESAKQELHRLDMLARKLQLPLLAALTRNSRPQPGQVLPGLHLSFTALLPQDLLLHPRAGGLYAAGQVAGGQGVPLQQEQLGSQTEGLRGDTSSADIALAGAAVACPDQGPPQHVITADYLAMLAATAAADGSFPEVLYMAADADVSAAAGGLHVSGRLQASQSKLPAAASFADVYLAAPVWGSQGTAPDGVSAQGNNRQLSSEEEEQQPQPVLACLPAHRVMLSSCCPYFEALLSARWHHDTNETPGQQHDQCQQQRPGRLVRVVVVPEADIHVAAALQHYLYTGALQVSLPDQTSMYLAGPAGGSGCNTEAAEEGRLASPRGAAHDVDGCSCAVASTHLNGCQRQHTEASPPVVAPAAAAAAVAAAAAAVALSGCCQACHEARTLLRLWRCAELLLLPDLQALCLAAVDAAAWQLDIRCCLVLLADCCQLGVPAAADGLVAALSQRAERDSPAGWPEWAELPAALQGVLVKAWADRRLQQAVGDDLEASPAAGVATAGLAPVLAGNGGSALAVQQAAGQQQQHLCSVVAPRQHLDSLTQAGEALASMFRQAPFTAS